MSSLVPRQAAATAGGGQRRPRDALPLVLAQFLCSFAGTTMNVAISSIATDLGTRRQRRADRDHRLHADDGCPDDPRQQADRYLGPQVLLSDRPDGLRRGRVDRGRLARATRPDPGLFAGPGDRDRAADPARLHSGDGFHERHQVARARLSAPSAPRAASARRPGR